MVSVVRPEWGDWAWGGGMKHQGHVFCPVQWGPMASQGRGVREEAAEPWRGRIRWQVGAFGGILARRKISGLGRWRGDRMPIKAGPGI